MFEEKTTRDTSKLAMLLFRVGIIGVFVLMVARMFQLQVVSRDEYRTLAGVWGPAAPEKTVLSWRGAAPPLPGLDGPQIISYTYYQYR